MNDQTTGEPPKRRFNWWKIGFFLVLFFFECAREWAVIMTYDPVSIGSSASVDRWQGFVSATGRWKRIDGGTPLTPAGIRIECRQDESRCYEVSYMVHDRWVSDPDLSWYDAKFFDDAVTYENSDPLCVRYAVRIDLKLKKVFATRDRKADSKDATCAKFEQRIEMTLGDGFEFDDPTKAHFVPLMWLLRQTVSK